MDSKLRLLAVASMVVVMASGCSSYRGASQAGVNPAAGTTGGGYGSGQIARTGQVARGGFGQQRRAGTAAVANDSCAACAASKAQSTYTYKPPAATKPAPRVVQNQPAPRPAAQAGQHNQQYYVERWKRQQQAQQQKPAPRPVSIYTGSYQQKTYTPTTYSGGSAAKTNTASTTAVASSGGGSSYTVKKGDTVFEIMRQTGVYWKDIISMNSLQPPYSISPGQTLRLK